MDTGITAHITEGPGLYKNPVVASSTIPRYPGYLPWADSAFLAGPPFFSDALYSNPAGDIPEWSSPIEPQSQMPQTTMSYETGLDLVSPGSWGAETDSESYDKELFSPVTSLGSVDWEALNPAPKRSWSEASSPCGDERRPSPNMSTSPSSLSTVNVKLKAPRATSRKAKSTGSKPTKYQTATNSSSQPTKSRKSASTSSKPTPPQKSPVAPVTEHAAAAEAEECRARRNHNLVEKQYRNRLNAQFERLLAILPDDHDGSETRPDGTVPRPLRSISSTKGKPASACGPDDRRISKAEVLEMATTRIRELEAERRRLQHERQELLRSLERAAGAAAGCGRIGAGGGGGIMAEGR